MNYPTYTKIYQICYLPTCQLPNPQQMCDEVNKQHPDSIYKPVVQSVSDWDCIMDTIIADIAYDHIVPILHLDMHGSSEGFGDSINTIGWDKLIEKITELNKACDGQLFLSLNVCEGLYIYHFLNNNNYPLSLKTLGSFDKIYANEGRFRFTEMYKEYFNSFDMNKAVIAFFNANPYRTNGAFELV